MKKKKLKEKFIMWVNINHPESEKKTALELYKKKMKRLSAKKMIEEESSYIILK